MHQGMIFLTALFVIGIAAQWLAWKLRLPAILLLLGFGFAAGQWMNPDDYFDEKVLFPIVSLSVAIILFDGGLSLRFSELKETSLVVVRMVTIGCFISWILGTMLGMLIFSDIRIAALAGAIFTVTGPTVIGPLLRHVRPVKSVGSIAKWEGIVIDPVGAVLAVLVFEAFVAGDVREAAMDVTTSLAAVVAISAVLGLGVGWGMILAFHRHWIPDYLHSPVLLAAVLGSFTISNGLQPESGLATVTVLGIVMANQKLVSISHLVEFKENLGVLLISVLFILLSSRLDPMTFQRLGWFGPLFLLGLILIVRPIAVYLSTILTGLPIKQRIFLAFLAPRGIVAAAVASVFALEIEHASGLDKAVQKEAELLVPLTFLVIVGTVAVYGLSAGPLARRLGLAEKNPQGVMFAGADRLTRMIAKVFRDEGFAVLLIDTNYNNISTARMEGLPVSNASILSEYIHDRLDFGGIGKFIAMTPNDQVNSLAVIDMIEHFGRANVYQLKPAVTESQRHAPGLSSKYGRYVFDGGTGRSELDRLLRQDFTVKITSVTEEFDYERFKQRYNGEAVLIAIVGESKTLEICTDETKYKPVSGQKIVALVPKVETTEQSA